MSTPTDAMGQVLRDVVKEREFQDVKWGPQNHGPEVWHLVISEELGEVAEAILTYRHYLHTGKAPDGVVPHMRAEAVQVAASAVAFIEYIDRQVEKGELP